MSKSKGNVVTPEDLLNEHSSDVFRYWASRGRLGVDSAFDETPFKIGRKLVIKIFNASKFVLTQLDGATTPLDDFSMTHVCTECDRAWIAVLKKAIDMAAAAFEDYDYTTALQYIEDSFWYFCDNYLEMIKIKAYQGGETPGSRSALVTLNWSLRTFLRLFAPFMPFLTEEIWSWRYSDESASIHKASWPTGEEVAVVEAPENEDSFAAAVEAISRIRGFKTENQVSQKRPVVGLEIRGSQANLDAIKLMVPYIVESTNAEGTPILTVDDTIKEEEGRFRISVELGEYKE
jgi:valyl-tRNA synthetase